MKPELIIPTEGFKPNTSFEEYISWYAVNASALQKGRRSVLHMHDYMNGGREEERDSDAATLGTITHTGCWEAEDFWKRYVVQPDFHQDEKNVTVKGKPTDSKNSKYCRAQVAEFKKQHPGKEPIDGKKAARCSGMLTALHAHPEANKLLATPGMNEVAMVWQDPETGVLCKGRMDKISLESRLLIDLKTTVSAHKDDFQRSILNWGYHQQIPHYTEGATILAGLDFRLVLIVVESHRPYGVAVYELEGEALDYGAQINHLRLRQWAAGCETGLFRGYDTGITKINLPVFGYKEVT